MQSSVRRHPANGRGQALSAAQRAELTDLLRATAREHHQRLRAAQRAFRRVAVHSTADADERQRLREEASLAFRTSRLAADALRAVDRGEYGACTRCGRPVPFEQLREAPLTSMCRGCGSGETSTASAP